MTYNQDLTRNNETEILRRTVEALLAMPGATGLHVAYDGDGLDALHDSSDFDAIKEACFAVDDCRLYLTRGGHKTQWVYFIWGNGNYGLDAITDYTVGLEEALKPVNDWIDQRDGMSGPMMHFMDVTQKLIDDLLDHEGAEGFSDSTRTLIDQYNEALVAVTGGTA